VMCNNEELVQEATLQQQYPNIVHVTWSSGPEFAFLFGVITWIPLRNQSW
jgi:hypothetical protein